MTHFELRLRFSGFRRGHARAFCVLVLLGMVVACASSIPHANEQHAQWASQRWPGVSVAELERGRDLYVQNCSGCHLLKDPKSQTPEQWPEDIREMREKMGETMNDEDAALIERYLITMSGTPAGNG